MSDRARRIAQNESLFRTVNEQVETLNRDLATISDETMHIVCECGDLSCVEILSVHVTSYERIRSDPAKFFVKPGHELPDVEDPVESASGFTVVRKHPGEPEEIARASDQRSA